MLRKKEKKEEKWDREKRNYKRSLSLRSQNVQRVMVTVKDKKDKKKKDEVGGGGERTEEKDEEKHYYNVQSG